MTKADLILAVSDKLDFTKTEVEDVVDAFLDAIARGLRDGEEIKLTGFGNFKIKDRKERVGTNPSDGHRITIPASRTVVFKPAKSLKGSL